MIPYPSIDPEIFRIGPFSLRWYGLMYLLGFFSSFVLALREVKIRSLKINKKEIEDLYFYLILGLIIGARLGYALFYNLPYYLQNPLEVAFIWRGGMSFHGGLLGAFVSGFLFIKKKGLNFFVLADIIIPTCPIGLGLGRIGNFINGELFGRPSDLPWAMVFPDGGLIPRHPSQIYEALLEGLILFVILWRSRHKKKWEGEILSRFLILYGAFRIFAEFFREPDPQVGFLLGCITMGQVLSFFMVIFGLYLWIFLLPRFSSPYQR